MRPWDLSYRLVRVAPCTWALVFRDLYHVPMAFLRYQEFAESPVVGARPFTWAEFMARYSAKNDCKLRRFTYMDDFDGFNLPLATIERCFAAGIPDPNEYDAIVGKCCVEMRADVGTEGAAYLIGLSRRNRCSALAHELSHALWEHDADFRHEAIDLLEAAPSDLTRALADAVAECGYRRTLRLVQDEITAYLATGDGGHFRELYRRSDFRKLRRSLRRLHRERMAEFLGGRTVKEILSDVTL